jgi:hypothetical protein
VSANPNLFDFNPSKLTFTYPGVMIMGEYFKATGFQYVSAEGGTDTSLVNFRQKILRPFKFIASRLKIIPETMEGKAWLKKMFFGGELVEMPKSVSYSGNPVSLNPVNMGSNDTKHKVLYFIGEKK